MYCLEGQALVHNGRGALLREDYLTGIVLCHRYVQVKIINTFLPLPHCE